MPPRRARAAPARPCGTSAPMFRGSPSARDFHADTMPDFVALALSEFLGALYRYTSGQSGRFCGAMLWIRRPVGAGQLPYVVAAVDVARLGTLEQVLAAVDSVADA